MRRISGPRPGKTSLVPATFPCHTCCFRRYRCREVSRAGPCSAIHEKRPGSLRLHRRNTVSLDLFPDISRQKRLRLLMESVRLRSRVRQENSRPYRTCASSRLCRASNQCVCHTARPSRLRVKFPWRSPGRVHDSSSRRNHLGAKAKSRRRQPLPGQYRDGRTRQFFRDCMTRHTSPRTGES